MKRGDYELLTVSGSVAGKGWAQLRQEHARKTRARRLFTVICVILLAILILFAASDLAAAATDTPPATRITQMCRRHPLTRRCVRVVRPTVRRLP